MWLITKTVLDTMSAAIKAGFDPSSDQISAFEARRFEAAEGGGRILTVAGPNAEIKVEGVLTKKPSFMAMIFGGGNTSYSEIVSALATADADPEVENITLAIDSPGGQVDGLFDTLAAIESTEKPISAVVRNTAASAAYAIAAQADSIRANNRAVSVGSIGIVMRAFVIDEEINITSDAAPKKRPDLKTVEGQAVVKEELNSLHALFAESIATGRGVSVDAVNSDFGQGAMLYGNDALAAGMIDEISGTALSVVPAGDNQTTASSGGKTKGAFMDLAKLKAEHPDVYADAVQNGVEKERDRVGAFLIAGEQSGDMKTAVQAITDGTEMTTTLSTTFMMAAANRGSVQAAQDDTDDVDLGDTDTDAAADDGDKVLAAVKDIVGFEGVTNG